LTPGEHGWHVHSYGDLIRSDGFSVGGHFIGEDPVRPEGELQEVGNIEDGEPIFADGSGVAHGYFVDTQVKLNGINSIVGRGMIIHEIDGARSSQCAIGRIADSDFSELTVERYAHSTAKCTLEPTENNADPDLSGILSFSQDGSQLTINYNVLGLSDGEHGVHVHDFGFIIDREDALAVGGHFIGIGATRDEPALDEVGYLGYMEVESGFTEGTFVDPFANLNGVNAILGRSVIIHGNAEDDGIRVAQCVIELNEEVTEAGDRINDYGISRTIALVRGEGINGLAELQTVYDDDLDTISETIEARVMLSGMTPLTQYSYGIYQQDSLVSSLGSLTADENGFVRTSSSETEGLTLFGDNSITGRNFFVTDVDGSVVASGAIGIQNSANIQEEGDPDDIIGGGIGAGGIAGIVIGSVVGVGLIGGLIMRAKTRSGTTRAQSGGSFGFKRMEGNEMHKKQVV
jgi:Cu/Zn superoxide dismutase